jgi:3-oxoacyl-[acyl-carrier protein] reductase
MDYGIVGRTALVVGDSKGIGLQAAMMLAAEGARVAIVARTQKHIDRAVASITENGGEAIGVSADMSSQEGIESAVAEVRERLAALRAHRLGDGEGAAEDGLHRSAF